MKHPMVYIMTNKKNGTLYTGVTSDLTQRIHQHKEYVTAGFTRKYKCSMLVFFEPHETMESAIMREKQIKAGSRLNKIKLIEAINPQWCDLYNDLF